MTTLGDLRTLAEGLDHPEGVAVAPDGAFYAGGEAGQLYRVDPQDGHVEEIARQENGSLLGVALDAAGRVYACDAGTSAVLRIDPSSGIVERWCEAAGGRPLVTPNWGAFDLGGGLWLSDSGSPDPAVRDGRLVRVPPPGGDAEPADVPALHFPNGLCVGPDDTVYVLESYTPRLSAFRDGRLETVVDLPGTTPDGVAMDVDGGFVVACYYPYVLLQVTAARKVSTLLADPMGIHLPMPTNVAHFGPDLDQLAIALLGDVQIKAMPAPVPGIPLRRP